jgi:predicted ATP-grasp superfamily ATP-dependent carboligase
MELWDAAGVRLLAAHVEACRGRIDGTWLPRLPDVRGKAVLFARRGVVVRESLAALAGLAEPEGRAGTTPASAGPPESRRRGDPARTWPQRAIADVPHPGERIAGAHPVCSLYATGSTASACLAALRALAARVERHLDPDPTAGPPTVGSGSSASSRA